MEIFDEYLSSLADIYRQADDEGKKLLLDLLMSITTVMGEQRISNQERKRILHHMRSYSTKSVNNFSDKSLKNSYVRIRNSLVHGRSDLSMLMADKNFSSELWKYLSESSDRWKISELSNFLSYCLGVERVSTDLDDSKKMVAIYRRKFNSLNDSNKERAFKELVKRIYLDPEMRDMIERRE